MSRPGEITSLVAEWSACDQDALDALVPLDSLAAFDPRKGKVFELRYFGGMSVEEVAEALALSVVKIS